MQETRDNALLLIMWYLSKPLWKDWKLSKTKVRISLWHSLSVYLGLLIPRRIVM